MKINRFLKITFFASLACFASEVLNSQSVYAQTVVRATQWGGLCLDIANPEGKGPQNGSPVLAFQCHGGRNQIFQAISDGTIRAPQWGGLCLDIANPEGKGPQNGAPVLAFQCHGGRNQIFQVSSDGTIRAPQWGGLCLDIANPEGKGPQNGSPVLAFQCHGRENQKWSLGDSTSPSVDLPGSASIETSSEVVSERYGDMGGGWGGAKATLYRNGLLVIEGRAVSNAYNSGTRTTVNVVGIDRRGNALFVSQHLDVPTACGRLDPTCPSDRRGRSDQRINSEIAKYVSRLNIHLSDRQGPTIYQNFVRNIREACSSYQELPAGVRQQIASQGGFSGCN